MTSPHPIHTDEYANVYAAAAADGRPAVRVVGTRPAPAAEFTAWAEAVRAAAGGPGRSPGLVPVLDARLDEQGRAVLVTDASGTTLAEHLTARGPLPAAEVVRTLTGVYAGLATLHAKGVRHGAVCPSTVVFAADGTPYAAGLDAGAPGLAAPIAPNRYTAPEGAASYASDVYALAATGYAALGGILPYADDPLDPALRRRVVPDIPGVPGEVVAALRPALHPDPGRRPSAAELAAALGALPVVPGPPPAGLPLAATDAGSAVRPVNSAVVPVNLAVSGAALAGIAATAGTLAGQQLPGAIAAATAAAGTVGTATAATGKASGATGLAVKVGAGVLAAALVAGGIIVGVNVLGDDPAPDAGGANGGGTPAAQGPMDEGIRSFDVRNAAFTPVFQGGAGGGDDWTPTAFANGTAVSHTPATADHPMTFEIMDEPLYADLDGDNDLDLVQYVTPHADGGQRMMYFWQWTDGAAVQVPYLVMMEEPCGWVLADTVVEGNAVKVTLEDSGGCGEYEPRPESSFSYAMRSGFPVQVAPAFGAAGLCTEMPWNTDSQDVSASGAVPLLAPVPGAPPIAQPGEYTAVTVDNVTAYRQGTGDQWILARVTRTDGSTSCGWLAPGTI